MKIRILTLILISSITFLTNCNNNDDNSTQTETLNGVWNLKNVSGGIAGIDNKYETGIITWTFDNQKLTLNVENNSSQENVYSGYESGTYPYSIVENSGIEYVLINTAEYGSYLLSVNNLIINQNEIQSGSGNDGFMLRFER